MRLKKKLAEEIQNPTSRLILMEFRGKNILKLKELQQRLGASIKRATLFRALKRLQEKNILERQKSRTTTYRLLKPKILEELKPTEKDVLLQIKLEKAANEISSSKKAYELAAGIELADPDLNLEENNIIEYKKRLANRPYSLLNVAYKIFLDYSRKAIKKYLEEARTIVHSIDSPAFQGYALGYSIYHLRWWCQSNNLDLEECQKSVNSFTKKFDLNQKHFSDEFERKINEVEEKKAKLIGLASTTNAFTDLSNPLEIIQLQEKGLISEEEEFWLLVLEKMAWEFRKCVELLPNKGPYIIIDTRMLRESKNAG